MNNDKTSIREVLIAVLLLLALVVGGGVLLLVARPQPVAIVVNPPIPTPTPAPSSTPAPVQVYVTGAVQNPQITLMLPPGSRVQEAINAAGGLSAGADMERVNPVALLRDGDHVHVFRIGEPAGAALPTASSVGLVYVNRATLAELETLPGIGPAIAQRIIDYREANGPFADFTALQNVTGIGPAIVGQLQGLVSFE